MNASFRQGQTGGTHAADVAHHPATIVLVAAAAVVSLALTLVAHSAFRRTRDGRLLYLVFAFLAFAAKGAVTAYSLWAEETANPLLVHEDLEAVGAAFDVLVLILLVAPLATRRSAR